VAKLLKNLYNEAYITILTQNIKDIYPKFQTEKFHTSVFDNIWAKRELKERMRHIATLLGIYLPQKYHSAIEILMATFNKMNNSFGLENMVFQDFVEIYGLDDVMLSLEALEIFTVGSSSEFAIRPFIVKYPQQTMQQMLSWAHSDNEHHRRLASEGSRPRLPWAMALPIFQKDPSKVLEILELLKDDSSAYVRKSVANNLNDISKDNPTIMKVITSQWIHYSKQRDSLLKHACRTLLKAGDKEVLELFGFSAPKEIKIENLDYTKTLKMGETLEFSFNIMSTQMLQKLRIEFAIGFLRKNNNYNTKVFQISESTTVAKEKYIKKAYSFKPISTRKYYKGAQQLSIIINGVVMREVEFMLS